MPTTLENHEHFAAAAERLIGGEEKLLRLGEASQILRATRGEQAKASTLARWIVRGKNGVRLDAVKLNGKGWCTSREALVRFATALSARAAGASQTQASAVGGSDRERRARAAMDAMERDRQRERGGSRSRAPV